LLVGESHIAPLNVSSFAAPARRRRWRPAHRWRSSVASTADRGDSGASTSRVATGATCRFRRTPRPRSRWGRSGSSPRPARATVLYG